MSNVDENSLMVISEFLETNFGASITKVQDFIRQRSITTDKSAISKCAKFLRNLLVEVGSNDARLIETAGNPIVMGDFTANSPYTLLIYTMYDTQPINADEWHFDPFGGEIVKTDSGDEVLYGRGSQNSK